MPAYSSVGLWPISPQGASLTESCNYNPLLTGSYVVSQFLLPPRVRIEYGEMPIRVITLQVGQEVLGFLD